MTRKPIASNEEDRSRDRRSLIRATPTRQDAEKLNRINIQRRPIEPLLVGEPHPLVWFTHLSAPQSRTAVSIADAQDGHNQDCAKTQRLWR
jgi:hypothetical protein